MKQAIEDSGGEVPTPDVPEWLAGVWRAWNRLTHDRPWTPGGMGAPVPRRIPWASVVGWIRFHELPDDDVAFFDACFSAMDAEYFEWYGRQSAT